MKDIAKIELEFENCEYVTIPVKYFGYFYMGKIQQEISRIALNSIAHYTSANEIAMEIFSEANTFGTRFPENNKENIFDRLTAWNDITHITVIYCDDTQDTYVVDYAEENDYLGADNLNQKTYLSEPGNLYIVIAKDKDIKDYFDIEEINNVDDMAIRKDLIMD